MKNVAFITYKKVGDNLSSGWHDSLDGRRALLIQQDSRKWWLVVDKLFELGALSDVDHAGIGSLRFNSLHKRLLEELQETLAGLDHMVVYLGRLTRTAWVEPAIALAAQLPVSKVTFVVCNCDLPKKEAMIQAANLTEAGRVFCECGGDRTMERLYNHFMETGEIRTA